MLEVPIARSGERVLVLAVAVVIQIPEPAPELPMSEPASSVEPAALQESSRQAPAAAERAAPDLDVAHRAEEESGLSRSIGRLFALAEDYPDLKASEGFMQLHDSLVEIEEHLQYARRYYNGSVRDNNNLVEGFPSLLVARLFRFRSAAFFEIELASQRAAPVVDLGAS